MEENTNPEVQENQDTSWSFVEESEVLAAQQEEQPQEDVRVEMTEEVPTEEDHSTEEVYTENNEDYEDYEQEDVEEAVFEYLSERLGYNVDTLLPLLSSSVPSIRSHSSGTPLVLQSPLV